MSNILKRLLGYGKRMIKNIPLGIIRNIRDSRIYTSLGNKLFDYHNNGAVDEPYFLQKIGDIKKGAPVAVVLHLYHPETWDGVFANRLAYLAARIDFDLYITMPLSNEGYISHVRKLFPETKFLIVPNKGRDVLPFIKTALLLSDLGYSKVLKVHSKKSKHRDGSTAESGDAWLMSTLDTLIPQNKKTMDELVKKVKDKNTGMIGPLEYYYPLRMYLGHNRSNLERILRSIDADFFEGDTSRTVEEIGYFGGTMFWADIKTLSSAFAISEKNFPKESGQTDSTMAHALERIFCILPQLKKKNVYGVLDSSIQKITPRSNTIPQWYYDDVSSGRPPTSIIVPVYGDWDSLSKNIVSLKKVVGNREDVSVYYVNDCGPEADTLETLINEKISGLANFYYNRNPKNLGFVKNCNNAVFEVVDQGSDILLLNSDTKVTKGFFDEMRKVMYSQDKIAAVTSRSNNATIWSVPMTARLAHHRPLSYILYRLIKGGLPQSYISPTVHGFCVLIRREVIKKYGLFDEVYGKGYGEENDFAMRVQRKGWKCAVANYSFVFHYESRSFGNEVRNKQIEDNEKILDKRYPEYRRLVQEYWNGVKEPFK